MLVLSRVSIAHFVQIAGYVKSAEYVFVLHAECNFAPANTRVTSAVALKGARGGAPAGLCGVILAAIRVATDCIEARSCPYL